MRSPSPRLRPDGPRRTEPSATRTPATAPNRARSIAAAPSARLPTATGGTSNPRSTLMEPSRQSSRTPAARPQAGARRRAPGGAATAARPTSAGQTAVASTRRPRPKRNRRCRPRAAARRRVRSQRVQPRRVDQPSAARLASAVTTIIGPGTTARSSARAPSATAAATTIRGRPRSARSSVPGGHDGAQRIRRSRG